MSFGLFNSAIAVTAGVSGPTASKRSAASELESGVSILGADATRLSPRGRRQDLLS